MSEHCHVYAREGLPYGHIRCTECNQVFKETLTWVGEFDRTRENGIKTIHELNAEWWDAAGGRLGG